jgi:hypothetical protein
MKRDFILLMALCTICVWSRSEDVTLPIADGTYVFLVKFAEHPDMTGGHLDVDIRGKKIRVTSEANSSVFPAGLVDEGVLLWHALSKQWIIGQTESDAQVEHVGGCSDGPFVVDLQHKVFWTC